MDPWILAIDYGTSNTAASVSVNGVVRSLHLDSNGDTMPSAVLLTPAGIVAGRQANNERNIDPASFEASPKRLIGQETMVLGGRTVQIVDLIAAVLVYIRGITVREMGGSAPLRVILTHPAAWTPTQLGRLREAAVRAGYPPEAIEMMSEPIAAARHYAAMASTPPNGAVAVFDIGGGTCDAALLQRSATGEFTILDHDGDNALGGSDFDDRIYAWVLDQLRASGQTVLADGITSPAGRADYLTLRDSIRAAKEALSTYPSTRIPIRSGGKEAGLTLTRTEYEELIRDDLLRSTALLRQVLPATGVAALYLTGGASKTPALHDAVAQATGITPSTLDDPKLVSARGALESGRPAPVLGIVGPPAPGPIPGPVPGPVPGPIPHPYAAPTPGAVPGSTPRQKSRLPLILGIGIPVLVLLLVGGGFGVAALINSMTPHIVPTSGPTAGGTTGPTGGTVTSPPVTPVATVDCWDGTTVSTDVGCPLLEGQAGALWVFPVLEDPNCVALDLTNYDPAGGIEGYQCRWDDLPNTQVNIVRYDINDDLEGLWQGYFDGFNDVSASDLVDDQTKNTYGTVWDGDVADSTVGGAIKVIAYGYIPWSMEVFTNSNSPDLAGDEAKALDRVQYRFQGSLDDYIDSL